MDSDAESDNVGTVRIVSHDLLTNDIAKIRHRLAGSVDWKFQPGSRETQFGFLCLESDWAEKGFSIQFCIVRCTIGKIDASLIERQNISGQ